MVENELLRGERTQTVPQQNVWLTAVLVLGDNSERNHVFNELIETAGSEVAKAIGRFCGQAMAGDDRFRKRLAHLQPELSLTRHSGPCVHPDRERFERCHAVHDDQSISHS
jgi:hypothetical protein